MHKSHHCFHCSSEFQTFESYLTGWHRFLTNVQYQTSFMMVGILLFLGSIGRSEATVSSNFTEVENRWYFLIVPGLTLLVVGKMGFNLTRAKHACSFKPSLVTLPKHPKDLALEEKLMATLSEAVKIKTISYDRESKETGSEVFLRLHELLKESFPETHTSARVSLTKVGLSLVYELHTTEDIPEAPLLFCAHQDVVPVLSREKWDQEPFSGFIDKDNVVWGRGTIDAKHILISLLQIFENIIHNKIRTKRSIFLAFGHDEEIGGWDGAFHMAKHLRTRLDETKHNYFEFILDEGTFVVNNVLPGVTSPVALIGVSEKGSMDVKIEVDKFPPGHSSMPTNKQNNVAVLAKAIVAMETNLYPTNVSLVEKMLKPAINILPLHLQVLISNFSLFANVMERALLKSPAMAATIRTTTSVTILNAGDKINVVPGKATAFINHRIHPSFGENLSSEELINKVLRFNEKAINDDRVTVSLASKGDEITPPSPVSDVKTQVYKMFEEAVLEEFNCPCLPTVLIGNTDTRHYWGLSKNIYRFTPVYFENLECTKMFHGDNERVSGENLSNQFSFYMKLLERFDAV